MSNDITNIGSLPPNPSKGSQQKVEEQAPKSVTGAAPEASPQVKREDSHGVSRQISQLGEISEHLANLPDVDSDKVSRIKQAIADGTFEIDPARVAQSLIDFETSALDQNKK